MTNDAPEDAYTPLTKDERTWGMLCHISSLAGFVVPFGNVVGPLVVWLIKKDESAFIDDQGKESLNFQITMTIATLVSFVLIFVLIGFILMPVIILMSLIFAIIGGVKANDGIWYRYPASIRLIK